MPRQRKDSKLEAAKAWLKAVLASGPRRVPEIRALASDGGLSWATVRRAADELRVRKTRVGFGPGGMWFWGTDEAG